MKFKNSKKVTDEKMTCSSWINTILIIQASLKQSLISIRNKMDTQKRLHIAFNVKRSKIGEIRVNHTLHVFSNFTCPRSHADFPGHIRWSPTVGRCRRRSRRAGRRLFSVSSGSQHAGPRGHTQFITGLGYGIFCCSAIGF